MNLDGTPNQLVADSQGNIFDIPDLLMAGMEGASPVVPSKNELIDLPYGSDLFMLPDRIPIGFDPNENEFVLIPEYNGEPVFPVAAFMAPAHMQFYLPAYREPGEGEKCTPLPMYGYTAVGWLGKHAKSAGIRIDPDIRQDLRYVDTGLIERRAPEMLKRYPGNRLVEHLVNNCVLCYGCPAARNFVLNRWECPVPTSSVCNAGCIGCISYQPRDSGVRPAQERISFTPNVSEIVEFTVPHLETAEHPVISFGQGCEGEPLLVADLIIEAIREIRKKTDRGIININTNGSLPDKVEKLCEAGLDSIRISMNSARPEQYTKYYQPKNYTFNEVTESLKITASRGKWTSLNYFIFPGITDQIKEIAALKKVVTEAGIQMIQTRNINIDPLMYWKRLGFSVDDDNIDNSRERNGNIGMAGWLKEIKSAFPSLTLGYFNPSRETMKKHSFIHWRNKDRASICRRFL